MASIIFAGEIVFALPFHIARFFRPTFLEVFALSNTQLGDIFAIYGLVAMLAYFPGGVIADRFSANKLMAFSLLATALGGVYLYSIPTDKGLMLLFGYWGVTSILLFWGAMIKATRHWGADDAQGLAFGLLDGGRGFVASLFASLAVIILSVSAGSSLHSDPLSASPAGNRSGLQNVIIFYTLITAAAAVCIWVLLPNTKTNTNAQTAASKGFSSSLRQILGVLKNISVWIQGGIVIAAYCGYKALDNYGIYAVEVLGMTQLESAEFTTLASYSRPIAAITAGLIVDRYSASRMIRILFALLFAVFLILAGFQPSEGLAWFVMANLLITFVAVYALRGVYFALLAESKLRFHVTGTAVGVISFLGFTPDIFFAPITGRILDANPGFVGFQHYFLALALVMLLGLALSAILVQRISKARRLGTK